ncbi:hypothetical protein RchiOBHm_Chr2g0095721 [Rosa chinensis]|uniref:Uncharacterized protein n=1 Tax=Rosa chinensis TaxID=74649 RepID=A0A2P6RKV7_ROSCH|nr:hypothetical protein RchiOBHm_Chr2g0095721 [Rosa chinensis]
MVFSLSIGRVWRENRRLKTSAAPVVLRFSFPATQSPLAVLFGSGNGHVFLFFLTFHRYSNRNEVVKLIS